MIRLAPLEASDLPRILAAIPSEAALVQWAGPLAFTHPLDLGQLARHLREAQASSDTTRLLKALDEGGEAVGLLEIALIQPQNGTASLCRVLVFPEHRGRGLCPPMIRAALRIAFQEFGLRRVDLRVYAFNLRAIDCYRLAGFVSEGLLRQGQRVGEELWDIALMGILRDEWAAADRESPA